MILKNTTDIPNYVIRRMVAFCVRNIEDLKMEHVRSVSIRNRTGGGHWSGHCYGRRVVVTVPANGTHCRHRLKTEGEIIYTKQWDKVEGDVKHDLQSRVRDLVGILAHELTHVMHNVTGLRAKMDGKRIHERNTCWWQRRVQRLFLENEAALTAEWFAVPERVAAFSSQPAKSKAERTLERNRSNLAKWERRLKAATNKVRKLRSAVRAGERYIEANRDKPPVERKPRPKLGSFKSRVEEIAKRIGAEIERLPTGTVAVFPPEGLYASDSDDPYDDNHYESSSWAMALKVIQVYEAAAQAKVVPCQTPS